MIFDIAIVAALGLLTLSGSPNHEAEKDYLSSPQQIYLLPIKIRDGRIYIRAQVNGRSAKLLVDTGSSSTTFSQKLVPNTNKGCIGANHANSSISAFRIAVRFTLGDAKLPEQRCSFRRSVLVGDFEFLDADGLVGLDILNLFQSVTLNFKDFMLVLDDR
jgi:hypothetical protein